MKSCRKQKGAKSGEKGEPNANQMIEDDEEAVMKEMQEVTGMQRVFQRELIYVGVNECKIK